MKRLFVSPFLYLALFLSTASGQDVLPLDKIANQADLDKTIAARRGVVRLLQQMRSAKVQVILC